MFQCDACAAKERKQWNLQQGRTAGHAPVGGQYFAVRLDEEVTGG